MTTEQFLAYMFETLPILYSLLRIAVLVYVGLGVVLLLSERSTVYLPNFPAPRSFEECAAFVGADNITYRGMRFHYKRVNRPSISDSSARPAPFAKGAGSRSTSSVSERIAVVYHGNAGSACDRSPLADTFERTGYSYLFVEYPGYAGDAEKPSKKRILAGVPIVQQFLEDEGYTRVVLVGESLGVGVAAYHASIAPPERIVFISPYYELADLAGWIRYVYPVRLLMRENYMPARWMEGNTAPVLLVQAEDDEIVPKQSAERLYGALTGKKTQVILPGTHNELYGRAEFYMSIESFLSD